MDLSVAGNSGSSKAKRTMAAPFVRIPALVSGSGVGAASLARRSGVLSSLCPLSSWPLPRLGGARTTATTSTAEREGEDATTTTREEARGGDGATGTSQVDNDFGFARVGREEHKELVKDVFLKGTARNLARSFDSPKPQQRGRMRSSGAARPPPAPRPAPSEFLRACELTLLRFRICPTQKWLQTTT